MPACQFLHPLMNELSLQTDLLFLQTNMKIGPETYYFHIGLLLKKSVFAHFKSTCNKDGMVLVVTMVKYNAPELSIGNLY